MSDHYYETHITVDKRPGFDVLLGALAEVWHMKVADFTSGDDDVPETVLTRRDTNRALAYGLVRDVVPYLQRCDFKVLRYKVELAVMDSKLEDTMGLLG